jgi:hypothetical protein
MPGLTIESEQPKSSAAGIKDKLSAGMSEAKSAQGKAPSDFNTAVFDSLKKGFINVGTIVQQLERIWDQRRSSDPVQATKSTAKAQAPASTQAAVGQRDEIASSPNSMLSKGQSEFFEAPKTGSSPTAPVGGNFVNR